MCCSSSTQLEYETEGLTDQRMQLPLTNRAFPGEFPSKKVILSDGERIRLFLESPRRYVKSAESGDLPATQQRQGQVAAVWNAYIGSPDLRRDRMHVVMLSAQQTRVDEVWLVLRNYREVGEPKRGASVQKMG